MQGGKRKLTTLTPSNPNKADYSLLPLFREILIEPDQFQGDDRMEMWSIIGSPRVDWNKYFDKQTEVHELVMRAAGSLPNNPIGFLRPDWVNRALQEYLPCCPQWAKDYAESFKKAARQHDFKDMKEWWEIIQNRV